MPITERDNKFFMSDDVSITHNIRNKDTVKYHEHYHDFVEMIYILRGKCIHTVDGKAYPMRRGDLLTVNYNQRHSISGASDVEYINILMKPEYISRSLVKRENAFALLHLSEFEDFRKILDENKSLVSFSGDERERLEQDIFMLESEINSKAPGYKLAVHSRFNLLLITVFRKMSLPIDAGFGGMSEELLAYIRQHCGEKITLEETAALCSYNPSYFSRIFRQYTGMTFTQYLKNERIELACRLIKETNRKINDIFPLAGYSDKTKFFAHFKAIKGMSPLEYRKSNK